MKSGDGKGDRAGFNICKTGSEDTVIICIPQFSSTALKQDHMLYIIFPAGIHTMS